MTDDRAGTLACSLFAGRISWLCRPEWGLSGLALPFEIDV